MGIFHQGHLLGVDGITRSDLEQLFGVARDLEVHMAQGSLPPCLAGRVMASLFFEPSTRTRMSFESACWRLGGAVNGLGAVAQSSLQKGESFRDTVRTIQHYADVLVIRHPEPGRVHEAAACVDIPVINAGDGMGEHPTQALLDLFTLAQKKPLDGLSLAIIGDLRHSRTVHSLIPLLPLFKGMQVKLVAPPGLELPLPLQDRLTQGGVAYTVEPDVAAGVADVDAVYVTRLQKERLGSGSIPRYYHINQALLAQYARPDLWVLHPLPRVDELAEDVDTWPGALYFEQARYGVLIRMALLLDVFGQTIGAPSP